MKKTLLSFLFTFVAALTINARTHIEYVEIQPLSDIKPVTYKFECKFCHKRFNVDCYYSETTNKYYTYNCVNRDRNIYAFCVMENKDACSKCRNEFKNQPLPSKIAAGIFLTLLGGLVSLGLIALLYKLFMCISRFFKRIWMKLTQRRGY